MCGLVSVWFLRGNLVVEVRDFFYALLFRVKDLFVLSGSRERRGEGGKVRFALLWLAVSSVCAAPYLSWRRIFFGRRFDGYPTEEE